jgi:hypothetical protein
MEAMLLLVQPILHSMAQILSVNGVVKSTISAGDEGGQVDLAKAVTNTTLTTGVSIDVYQNRLRFFETGGTSRGYYLDISAGGASVGTAIATAFTGTASRAVVTDGAGALTSATTTSTEIGYVNGVTSAIQTQLDGKVLLGPASNQTITAGSASVAPLILKGAASQTGLLLQGQTSAAAVVWAAPASTGPWLFNQPTPAAIAIPNNSGYTLTAADLKTRILTISTVGNNPSISFPTGTTLDTGFGTVGTDLAFDWTLINNTGSNLISTTTTATGHTYVGVTLGTLGGNASYNFRTRRTGTNTWVTYRLT